MRAWVEKKESELTFEFSFENTLYSAYTSFLTQTPSGYTVQSITEMIIWKLSFDDVQHIYNKTSVGEIIGRKAAENLYNEKCQREFSLLTKSAEQRYRDLFSEQPRLIKEIPLKYLASYIGVTPQALSRIRRRFF